MRMEWRRKETRQPGLQSDKEETKGKGTGLNQSIQQGNGRYRHARGAPQNTDHSIIQNFESDDNSSTSKFHEIPRESPSSSSSAPAIPSTGKPRRRRDRRRNRRNHPTSDTPPFQDSGDSSMEKDYEFQTKSHRSTHRKEVQFGGKSIQAIVTADSRIAERWLQRQTGKLFGMDLEWKPNYIKGQDNKAALLQLCGDRDCLILQLFYLDAMPPSLLQFLDDPEIKLAGVKVANDADKLAADYDFSCRGLVDLPSLAVNTLDRPDLKRAGLKSLAAEVLGLSLEKSKKITMSNWQNQELTSPQIDYACIDAYISFAIAQKLFEHP